MSRGRSRIPTYALGSRQSHEWSTMGRFPLHSQSQGHHEPDSVTVKNIPESVLVAPLVLYVYVWCVCKNNLSCLCSCGCSPRRYWPSTWHSDHPVVHLQMAYLQFRSSYNCALLFDWYTLAVFHEKSTKLKVSKLKVSQLFSKTYFSASPCKFIFFYLTIFVGFVARKLPYKIFDISRRIPGLANISLENEILRWPLRPKQHQMEHLTFDFAVFANPREFSCLLDEDLVGRLKKITAHTHPATMSVWVLEHYAVCAAHRWVGNLHGLKKGCLTVLGSWPGSFWAFYARVS